MATIGRVVVDVDANTARFAKKLDRSMRKMDRFGRGVRNLNRTFAGLFAAAGFGGFALFARDVVKAGLAMERFERALKVATGSTKNAAREMQFVISTAQNLGINLESTAGAYSKLAAAARGTALQGQATREIFLAISEASVVLGLTAAQTGGALTAIEQIISKGKVSAEELRGQLGERLPGAFQIAARAIGKTTAELDVMLRKGELTAEQLLPELARELRETFGPEIEEAANSAQAAFARFSNSILLLQDSIARSGVLDALGALADKTSAVIAPTTEQRIDQVRQRIDELKQSFREAGGFGEPTAALRDLRMELLELLKVQSMLANEVSRANPTKAILSISATSKELDDFFKKQDKELEKLRKRFGITFATVEQDVSRTLKEFDLVAHLFPEEEQERIRKAISAPLFEGIEEIVITTKRRFTEPMKKELGQIEEASKQAARNIQDAFAEFLFDPFDDGLKGMLRSFLDAVRRMVANKAATQLFGFLGGLFGDALGGDSKVAAVAKTPNFAFASGGSFGVGGVGGTDSQPVFFKASPNETVTVTKPGQSPGGDGISVFNNYEINGADPERSAEILAPLFAQNREETIAMIEDMRQRRQF